MIITCPCENKKKFKIDPSLIPSNGRDLQCGTCGQIWFYKIEKNNPIESKNINENEVVDQIEKGQSNIQSDDIKVNNLSLNEIKTLIHKVNNLELLIKKNNQLSNHIINDFILERFNN